MTKEEARNWIKQHWNQLSTTGNLTTALKRYFEVYREVANNEIESTLAVLDGKVEV